MSIFETCICDLCGKELYNTETQYHRMYALPYFIDDDLGVTTDPFPKMNLCLDCATKIRDFCKTLDHVNGYKYEAELEESIKGQINNDNR